MKDWREIGSAPHNATEIRVRDAAGGREQVAHWACDLSGEEQPPFRGWFRAVRDAQGRVLRFVALDFEPAEWTDAAPAQAELAL